MFNGSWLYNLRIKGVKIRIVKFLVNHIFVGTQNFEIKKKLLNSIGYELGEGTKVVGPIYNTGKLITGKNCWIGKNLIINGNGTVVLGDNCDIAPEVTFLTGGHKIGSSYRRAGSGEEYRINIGSGTWVGSRVTIAKNISIGNGCVVATCACVINDIDDNNLIGGIPARVIKHLDDKEIIFK